MDRLRRLVAYGRTAAGLYGYLRQPLSQDEAERLVAAALPRRQARLLALLQRVYARPDDPYRALLVHAGVAYPAVEALIEREGVDGALLKLAAAGVYVSLDEFKGRRPIRRGSLELPVAPDGFAAPDGAGLRVRSGATRSAGTPTLIGFELLAEEAAHRSVLVGSFGHGRGPVALWLPILPGSAGISNVLRYAKLGRPPDPWFSHAPVSLGRGGQAAGQTRAMLRLGRLFGSALPTPEYVPLAEADRVAEWAVAHRRQGRQCQVVTYVSSAVRICATGARLDGVLFVVIGEPLTAARVAAIRASGADVTCTYSLTEAGTVACGCGDPAAPDDAHVLLDRAVVVRHRPETGGHAVDGLFVTTRSPHARKVMLNVETGDSGRLTERLCACSYGRLGYAQHLDSVVSYEKLTGEGMTYDASELARVVEEVLPIRFGGSGTDYQALEEVGADGLTRLTLLASPRLGPLDEAAVVAVLRAELRHGTAGHRLAEMIWGQAGSLGVRRAEPVPTTRGKLFPFAVARPSPGGRR